MVDPLQKVPCLEFSVDGGLSAAGEDGATVRRALLELFPESQDAKGERLDKCANCVHCTAARERGALCALPGCGLAHMRDDERARLSKCARCRRTAYCSKEHQVEDWALRHKKECKKLRQEA